LTDSKPHEFIEEFTNKYDITFNLDKRSNFDFYKFKKDNSEANMNIYHTGTILVQGKESELKDLIKELKDSIEHKQNIQITDNHTGKEGGKHQTYEIENTTKEKQVKDFLLDKYEIINNRQNLKKEHYIFKIKRNNQSITITQFKSGTLLLQGGYTKLFDEICDEIEAIIIPQTEEVISRFIPENSTKSDHERPVNEINIDKATEDLIGNISKNAFEFLTNHDRDYLLTAECLKNLDFLKMPEYSFMVMPAAKGYEGFTKKLMYKIGFLNEKEYTSLKSEFYKLGNLNANKYSQIFENAPRGKELIEQLKSSIKSNRHYWMHSDNSKLNKIGTYEEAVAKIEKIQVDIKNYFQDCKKIFFPNWEPEIKEGFRLPTNIETIRDIITDKVDKIKITEERDGYQFNLRKKDWNGYIVIYDVGKIVRYGEDKLGNNEIAKQIRSTFKMYRKNLALSLNKNTSNSSDKLNLGLPIIGTDESGKGDYYGPLVCAAVYVNSKIEKELIRLGIRDSKKLSDKKIRTLAGKIKLLCEDKFTVIEISPKKYNELYSAFKSEGKNLNNLLGWIHAKAIEETLSLIECDKAVSDQFGDEKYIIDKLQEKGSQIQLIQITKGERNIAVAAASILARERFIRKLDYLGKNISLTLPKGGGNQTIEPGRLILRNFGESKLKEVAKMHFKNTEKIKS